MMEKPLAPEFIVGSRVRGYARWISPGPSSLEREAGSEYEIHVITGNPRAEVERECRTDRRAEVRNLMWFRLLASRGLKPLWEEGSRLYGDKHRSSKIVLLYVDKVRGRQKVRYTGRHHGFTAVYEQRGGPFWAVIAYAERPLGKVYRVARERTVER